MPIVQYTEVPNGESQVQDTLRRMSKLAHDRETGGHSIIIRQWATRVVHHVPGKDQLGELAAIYKWVRDNIRYRSDPHGLEWLQSPARTLEERAGDCDDLALIIGSAAIALGRPIRFKISARRPGQWEHVWVEAQVNGRWIPLDPVLEDRQPTTAPRADLGKFGQVAKGKTYTRTFNAQGAPMAGFGEPVSDQERKLWGYGVPYFPQVAPVTYPSAAGRGGIPPRPDLAYRSPGAPGPNKTQLLWNESEGQHVARPAGLRPRVFRRRMWDPSGGHDFKLGDGLG